MYKIFLIIAAVLAYAQAASFANNDAYAQTVDQRSDVKEDGSYNYQFQTSNGIAAQEAGVGGYYATGSSSYYSPEGELIQLTYKADENGYQPQGAHLPTPPPIPVAILKSLEYIRTHPGQDERQGSVRIAQKQFFNRRFV